MTPRVTAVVPTVGASPCLEACLVALRQGGEDAPEVLVVAQGDAVSARALELADRVLRFARPLGFAAATNRGLSAAAGTFLATVNDDVVVSAGWCRSLVALLDRSPGVAAAQGLNVQPDDRTVDGGGIGWNRGWQAVQIERGTPAAGVDKTPREVFGVSATAALYRREALAAVCRAGVAAFDEALGSYYEDVDLAIRLRAAGWQALLEPAARARHGGSATGRRRRLGPWPLVYGNRHLVLARLLGRRYWWRLPRLWLRDSLDLWHAVRRGDAARAAGIVAGWARATRRLPRFAHAGAPLLSERELARFRDPR